MVIDQEVTREYALYNGDSCEVMPSLPDGSIHLCLYSPPFAREKGGLYAYSSSERDLSNSRTYGEFFEHYEYIVRQVHRVLMPGRITAVHCMDVPRDGANAGAGIIDFPGDIIRLHERLGFVHANRYCIWKEPLGVRNRTMAKDLAHKQLVEDSVLCGNAGADYILTFWKRGKNPVPVAHPVGLSEYAGATPIPADLLRYKDWDGKQTENRLSHWIWRRYASCNWDDVRIDRVLPYRESKDPQDEKHVHPLQLDPIERGTILWTNPGETVLTPFMGVGSEVYGAVLNGRRGIGIELKGTYYRQAVCNLQRAAQDRERARPTDLFTGAEEGKVSHAL